MTKKIITIVVLVLISAALVYGSIYRTQAVYGISSPSGGATSSIERTAEGKSITGLVTLTGTVESVASELWVLRLEDGSTIEVEGRSLTYMASKGFDVEEGQSLSMVGFYETPESFEISQLTNLDSGETIILRGADGRPVWGKGGGGGE
jgi:hypothetical protein